MVFSTKFWLDEWSIFSPTIQHAQVAISDEEAEMPVSDFCDDTGCWDLKKLHACLPLDIVHSIASMWTTSDDDSLDTYYWKYENDGLFSVSYAYRHQFDTDIPSHNPCNHIWEIKCTYKQHVFL